MRAAFVRILLRILRMLIKEVFLACVDMILQQAASAMGVFEGQGASAEGGEQGGRARAEEGAGGEGGLLD